MRKTPNKPERDIPTSTIHTMLQNPFYYGYMIVKGIKIQHIYPPIIDEILFERVQDTLHGRCRLPAKSANEEKEFMYNDRLLKTTFDRCVSTLVYENIHRFQNKGLSAVSLPLVCYMNQIYVNKPYKDYFNNLIECERRYIQAYVMRNFSYDFIRYYNQCF